MFSFSITLRLQYCFLVRSKTLSLSQTSTEAQRHVITSFFNQRTRSQLSFFDKARPYVFICAVLHPSSFALHLYSPHKTTSDTVQKRCKEWSSFQTELFEKKRQEKKKSSWGRQILKGDYVFCQCLDRQLLSCSFYFLLCISATGSVSLLLSLSLNPVELQFSLSLASKEYSKKGILFKVDTRIIPTFLHWPQKYFHDYSVFLKNSYFSAICVSLEVLILSDDYCIHMVMMS